MSFQATWLSVTLPLPSGRTAQSCVDAPVLTITMPAQNSGRDVFENESLSGRTFQSSLPSAGS